MSVAAMSAAVITGLAGAGAAYQIVAGGDSPANTSIAETSVADTSAVPADKRADKRARARFAPCQKPAVLEKGACVTDVVRTVVLPGARTGASARSTADDGRRDAFDDHGDDGQDAADDRDDDPSEDAYDDHGDDDSVDDDDHGDDDHDDDSDDSIDDDVSDDGGADDDPSDDD